MADTGNLGLGQNSGRTCTMVLVRGQLFRPSRRSPSTHTTPHTPLRQRRLKRLEPLSVNDGLMPEGPRLVGAGLMPERRCSTCVSPEVDPRLVRLQSPPNQLLCSPPPFRDFSAPGCVASGWGVWSVAQLRARCGRRQADREREELAACHVRHLYYFVHVMSSRHTRGTGL